MNWIEETDFLRFPFPGGVEIIHAWVVLEVSHLGWESDRVQVSPMVEDLRKFESFSPWGVQAFGLDW